ncbi:MAG: hypothetical protein PHH57_02770 [Candidatus Omnitrophica bacterium]|nr:hypothetical protein [Candidatus Omnitrophota bacterium]
MKQNGDKAYQLSLMGTAPLDKPRTYRQKQLLWRRWRVANRKRLRLLPLTEAEESIKGRR